MIKAEEISEIFKKQLQGYEAAVDLQEAGRVLEVGDGIARIYGLEGAMAGELLQFPGDVYGLVLNLEEDNVGAVLLGSDTLIKEGDHVTRTKRIAQVPVGEALTGRVVDALGQPVDGKGPIASSEFRPLERYAPGVVDRRSVKEPLQTGLKAIDAMIPIGRGQRELIIGDRGTGKTAIGVERAGGLLLLRRHRPETLHRRPGREGPRGHWCHGVYDGRHRLGLGAGCAAVPGSLCRLRHGGVLPRLGPPCPLHLRRSFQARHGLSADVASAPPAAGPRGLPGRRLLSSLAAPRAGRQAQRRAGRGIPHRAAHNRNAAGRRVCLYPDQRHLDHGRPDLSRVGSLLLRHPAGRERGPLRLARRRIGADQGNASDRRQTPARPRPVPRAGGFRAIRLRPRQVDAPAAGPRPAHGGAAQAGPVRAPHGREADHHHLRGRAGAAR